MFVFNNSFDLRFSNLILFYVTVYSTYRSVHAQEKSTTQSKCNTVTV